ncbi:MAG: hypothetical protein L3J71_01015 [Victivallaceae bacterium]|nr:hypothetical protein [Victivallaceae bacterium]
MKKIKFLLLLGACCCIITSGCRAIKANKKIKAQAISQNEQAKLDMIADRYGNELLKSIQENNYELFIKNFMPEAKKRITKAQFEAKVARVKEKMGDLVSHKFLTSLDQNMLKTYVWKTNFVRSTSKGPVKVQEIFRIMVVKLDGQYYIWNFYLY